MRASIFGKSAELESKSGNNMSRMRTCSQNTMTLASNSSLSGMRHALSVPHKAAPRPDEPRTVVCAARVAVFHATVLSLVAARVNECESAYALPRAFALRPNGIVK